MSNRLCQKLSLLLIILFFGWAGRSVDAGSIEERDGKTIIQVKLFAVPDPSDTGTNSRAAVAAVREFQRQFPQIFREKYRDKYLANPEKYGRYNWDNVAVEFEQFTGIQVEGVETDLLAIAGGVAPDVLYVNFRKSDNYIQSGFLYPLDKPEDGYLTSLSQEELDFRIHPKLWPVIRRKGPEGAKHVWALPYGGALGRVLMFRKDVFDRYGVAYPTVNWTWDDMLEASRKLTDPKNGVVGVHMIQGKHESWNWVSFLWSAGGDVMTYDEATDEWRCTFDSDEAVAALDFYIRLNSERWVDAEGKIRRGYTNREIHDLTAAGWNRGLVAMNYNYLDEKAFSSINPELTGMVPVPLGPTGKRGAEINSTMMGLFSQIKDPAVRDAAWEYMRFYDSIEATAIKTQIMVEGGLGQFINPKYLRRFGYSEIERIARGDWAETFNIAIETGQPEPYGRNSNFAYDLMTIPLQQGIQLSMDDQLPEDPQARYAMLKQLLVDANARANEEMIGIITPQERSKRRIVAWIVLGAIVAVFAIVFRKIFKTFGADRGVEAPTENRNKGYGWAYALLVPALVTILIWQYIPLGRGSVMAFQDYKIIGESSWVGVDQFGDVIHNWDWWGSVWNSLRYSMLVISMTFLPPIVLAILLQEVPRGSILFRTIYYLPAVVTGLVTVLLWKQFYHPSDGALNAIVMNIPAIGFVGLGVVLCTVALLFAWRMMYHNMRLAAALSTIAGIILLVACINPAWEILFPDNGASFLASLGQAPFRLFKTAEEPYRWLGDTSTAMIACVIPMVWAGIGPGCLIYLAALKGIPDDYYEAADLDGATFIDKILFVIFPMLKPLIIINFVGVFIGAWYGASGNILAMTGGGANTEVADLHIWYKAFTFLNFGAATSMAWMLGFMLIGFTVYQLRILSRVEFRSAATEGKK